MPIIATMNYKGGVGKTTTTANLAAELAWRGNKVLLLDLDAQASLTFSFVKPDFWSKYLENDRTIKSWFESHEDGQPIPLEDLVIQPPLVRSWNKIDGRGDLGLIASHLGLLNVDLELATQLGGASPEQNAKNYLRVHERLRTGLESMEGEYDIVLMDCPPNFNIVTKTAIIASDFVLVPAKPDYLSTLGIQYLMRNLDQLKHDFNFYAKIGGADPINTEILGVIFTMIQVYGGKPILAQRQFINEVEQLEIPVMKNWIRTNNSLFSDAPQYGIPVVLRRISEPRREIENFVTEFQKVLGI